MTTIGVPIEHQRRLAHYAQQAVTFGQRLPLDDGAYHRWQMGDGAELWVQTSTTRGIIGLNPHFGGSSLWRVGLTKRFSTHHLRLDGAFYGWMLDRARSAHLVVFDVPDYVRYRALPLPTILPVQVAGFAHRIIVYTNRSAFFKSQAATDSPLGLPAFHPVGMFDADGYAAEQPTAHAIIAGMVLQATRKRNKITDRFFWWAQIDTPAGPLDIVADEGVIEGELATGAVVDGVFWLSGRPSLGGA